MLPPLFFKVEKSTRVNCARLETLLNIRCLLNRGVKRVASRFQWLQVALSGKGLELLRSCSKRTEQKCLWLQGGSNHHLAVQHRFPHGSGLRERVF